MIKKISVKNLVDVYGSINPISIDENLKKLNILIGENGTGKTTFMKVIFNIMSGLPGDYFYDNVSIEYDVDGIKNHISHAKSLPFRNWFRFMNEIALELNLNRDFTNWSNNSHDDNNVDIRLTSVTIPEFFKDKIFTKIKLIPGFMELDENSKNSLNTNYHRGNIGNIFLNWMSLLQYHINGSLKHDLSFLNSVKKNELFFFLRSKFLETIDIHDQSFKVELISDLNTMFPEISKNSQDLLEKMIKDLIDLSKISISYVMDTFLPLKKRPEILDDLEFIFVDRSVVNKLKKEINFEKNIKNHLIQNIQNNELKFEMDKIDAVKMISDYNHQLQNKFQEINNKIMSSLHLIDDSIVINDAEIAKLYSMLKDKNTEHAKFIGNVLDSENLVCKKIRAFISNSSEIINSIDGLLTKSELFYDTVEHINLFLKDTFKHKVQIVDGEMVVIKDDLEKVKMQSYKFSTGQEMIIGMISNILLSNKKVFIIDEPEISLSIIWQDKLFKFFKAMTSKVESDKQFFLITHSHFMLDPNKENTCVIVF